MRARSLLLPSFVILLAGISLGGGMDPFGIRQTAGIFVTVDGKALSIFIDFESLEYKKGKVASVEMKMDTDLDLFVEGHCLPSGRHRWTFEVESEESWSIGEDRQVNGDAKRYLLSLRNIGVEARRLAASLVPDPERSSILLTVRYGPREGVLRFRMEEGKKAHVGAKAVDVVALRLLRDRLRTVAGALAVTRRNRCAWSSFLLELGDCLHDGPGQGFVREAWFDEEEERVAFTVRGLMPGGRKGVEELGHRLAKGGLARLFERVAPPLPRLDDRTKGWSFEITAEASKEWWRRSDEVPALASGEDPRETAEEILLLEARLERETEGAVTGLAECRTRILEAKRDAAVLISGIKPGERTEDENGLVSFPVKIKAAGSGPSIIQFIRAIEDWKAPLRIIPRRIDHGDFGPRVEMDVLFLSYIPLDEREPGVYASVRAQGRSADFEENREVYLQGVGKRDAVPFYPPTWTRDPFALPREE